MPKIKQPLYCLRNPTKHIPAQSYRSYPIPPIPPTTVYTNLYISHIRFDQNHLNAQNTLFSLFTYVPTGSTGSYHGYHGLNCLNSYTSLDSNTVLSYDYTHCTKWHQYMPQLRAVAGVVGIPESRNVAWFLLASADWQIKENVL
jgi:hypothetical protein